jgi:hypothetical protein
VAKVEHASDAAWTPIQKNMAAMAGAQLCLQHNHQFGTIRQRQQMFEASLQEWNPWTVPKDQSAGASMRTLPTKYMTSEAPPMFPTPDDAGSVAVMHVSKTNEMADPFTTPTIQIDGEHFWLVRTGPPGKLRWRECEPELAAKMENA